MCRIIFSNNWTDLGASREVDEVVTIGFILYAGRLELGNWLRIGRDGTIQDLKLVRGYFALGLAAVDAVKQWRFRPYRVNGEIVQMQTFLTVNFPMVDAKDKPDSNGSLMTYGAWR